MSQIEGVSPAAELSAEIARRWPHAVVDEGRVHSCVTQGCYAPADLYLARSAARGEAWALDVFERDVFAAVGERLARKHGRAQADEALQEVREQLLASAEGGLATYSGRGPLKAWLTVIAVRRLMALRSEAHASLGAAASALGTDETARLELSLLRARYGEVFRHALAEAFESLERRARLVLRLHVVDGLSAEKVGAIFHVHRATASQWIAQARAELHEQVTAAVQRDAGLSHDELLSIGRALQRHTDFSLPRLLAGHEEAR